MPLGILLVNVVSVSSSIGALTALAVLYVHLRSRGVLLLAAAVLFLTADYTLGLVLFSSPGSPLWRGLPGIPVATRADALLLGLKGMLQVGVLLTAPLAVSSLFGRKLPRLVLWTGSAVALAALVPSAVMTAGLFPDAWGVLSAISAVPGYVAYATCFVILLANREAARPGLSRGIVRAAVAAFAVCIPCCSPTTSSRSPAGSFLLPTDALAFLVLSGGVLVVHAPGAARRPQDTRRGRPRRVLPRSRAVRARAGGPGPARRRTPLQADRGPAGHLARHGEEPRVPGLPQERGVGPDGPAVPGPSRRALAPHPPRLTRNSPSFRLDLTRWVMSDPLTRRP